MSDKSARGIITIAFSPDGEMQAVGKSTFGCDEIITSYVKQLTARIVNETYTFDSFVNHQIVSFVMFGNVAYKPTKARDGGSHDECKYEQVECAEGRMVKPEGNVLAK